MANEQNLRPIRDSNTARELQEKSAKKKSENAKERKLFKEEIIKRLNAKDFEEIIDSLIKRAKKNDKAFEVLRDTIGQKPKEEISANVENVIKVELKDD